mgnify:CR=1 FL=1
MSAQIRLEEGKTTYIFFLLKNHSEHKYGIESVHKQFFFFFPFFAEVLQLV